MQSIISRKLADKVSVVGVQPYVRWRVLFAMLSLLQNPVGEGSSSELTFHSLDEGFNDLGEPFNLGVPFRLFGSGRFIIDVSKVVDRFASLHPRHLEMKNMVYS